MPEFKVLPLQSVKALSEHFCPLPLSVSEVFFCSPLSTAAGSSQRGITSGPPLPHSHGYTAFTALVSVSVRSLESRERRRDPVSLQVVFPARECLLIVNFSIVTS